jgi:V/A-type H+-transporting ATPase subunit E
MTGLEKITARIEAQARERARVVLQKAEEDCCRLAEEYAARAEQTRTRIAEEAAAAREVMISSTRSAVEKEERELIAATRKALVDEAFDAAKKELFSTDYGKYRELLVALLVNALLEQDRITKQSIEMGDEVEEVERFEVLLNAADRERFGTAVVEGARRVTERRIGAANAAKLCLAPDTADIDGGLVLRLGNVELNCSLSVVLADLRTEMECRVAELLFRPEEEKEEQAEN